MEQQDQAGALLSAILSSPQFAQSRRMQRFLALIVERAIAGRAEELKEYTIGVEVFDRPADYDPRIDSIVRVEARRLRRKLREYYAGPGKKDAVVISLPEGSYIPQFSGLSAPAAAPPPLPPGPRLAVLPLETAPGSPDALMLAGALTDDLLASLARIPGLLVVTRSTTLRFAEPGRDLKAISSEIGVDWILEGSLRRAGDGWRLNVLLAECATGFARWSASFSAGAVQLQTLHEPIAREVASRLGVSIPVPAGEASDADAALGAFRHLLEGRHLMLQMTPRSLRRAADAFRRAAQADPLLAAAWAGLGGSMLLMSVFGDTAPTMVATEARGYLQRALEVNPELPQARVWRGFYHATYEWNWDAAEEDFLRALEINPNLFMGRLWLAAAVYAPLRRYGEARSQLSLARGLDAANPVLHALEGLLVAQAGDLARGLELLRAARGLSRTFYGAHHLEARVLAGQGDFRRALDLLEDARPRAGSDPRNLALIACIKARLGQVEEASEIAASLRKAAEHAYVAAYDMAAVSAALGDTGAAAASLMQAYSEHEPWLVYLRQDPLIRPLDGTPQYREVEKALFNQAEE